MRNSKIFLGASALVLTVAGVFAGRASTKWIGGGLYITAGATHVCTTVNASIPNHFSATTGTNQASVKSIAGTSRLLWTNSTCSNKAYFRP